MPIMSWTNLFDAFKHIWCFCYLNIMLQIEGSKNARVGLLFNANRSPNLFSLLFVKVFEITASLYRYLFGFAFNSKAGWILIDCLISILWFSQFLSEVEAPFLYQMFERMVCSHKTNVLDFLNQLCSLYEKNSILSPPMEAESTQAFVDMVCELGEANGLPSKGYRSALLEFPAGEVRKHLTKVLLVYLAIWTFAFSS